MSFNPSTEIGGTERQVAAQRQKLLKKLQIQSDAQLTAAADELAWGPTKKNGARFRIRFPLKGIAADRTSEWATSGNGTKREASASLASITITMK